MNNKRLILAVVIAVAVVVVWRLRDKRDVVVPVPDPVVLPAAEPFNKAEWDIVGERMADTNYVAALEELIGERRVLIGEAHAVRSEMGEMLAEAGKIVEEAGSAQDSGRTDSGTTVRELEAPAISGTNTALQARGDLGSVDLSPAAQFDGIAPALLAYVRQQPEWNDLEARLNVLTAQQAGVQVRTESLIRERMKAQYAARKSTEGNPAIRPPDRVIKPMTNAPDFRIDQPVVVTNVPDGGMKVPPVPERRPVE